MRFSAAKDKITTRHLNLLAIIYIRQSTKRQVDKNKGSAAYQRSFRDHALRYGWTEDLIVVVDQDQGKSGTSIAKRHGLKWVRQQIFEERVGAVLCSEESRLGRDFTEFAQLVKLCAVYNTLIIDEKGVYDPNNSNDLTTLNIIGAIGSAEVRRNADRSVAAKRILAEKGQLILPPPTGYIYNDEDKLVFDPDVKVQDAIRLLFSKFGERGTAMQVTKEFNRNGIKFPSRFGGYYEKNRKIIWKKLRVGRVLSILHNPIFAGAYAYGRSKVDVKMVSAEVTEEKKKRVPQSWDHEEAILIKDTHQAYITWEKFLENRERLKDNRYLFSLESSGAVRDGSALLQGRVQCGSCLRRMFARYNVNKYVSYACTTQSSEYGLYGCLLVSTRHLDKVVTDAFFEALSPAQVRITLQALEEIEKQPKSDTQRELDSLNRARDEVDEARRRFESIDPENDLVAKEYQKKLQVKMIELKRLEAKRAKAMRVIVRQIPDEVRQSLLALCQDVRSFWDIITYAERKTILRCLIEKVILKRQNNSKYIDMTIRWKTAASSFLTFFADFRCIRPAAVELMRKLAPDHTIRQIVEQLNQAGFKPAKAESFSQEILYDAFRSYKINIGCRTMPKGDKPRGDGRYSAQQTAKMLGIARNTVVNWCNRGILDGIREAPRSPIWIKITPKQVSDLKKLISAKTLKSK